MEMNSRSNRHELYVECGAQAMGRLCRRVNGYSMAKRIAEGTYRGFLVYKPRESYCLSALEDCIGGFR